MEAKQWSVDLYIDEHDGATRAEARLHTRDRPNLVGTGTARRNPHDNQVPEIGEELAASRACTDLAHQLLEAVADDIEAISGRPAHLTG